MQLLLKLENVSVSMSAPRVNEMSLSAELEMLSHSLSVDSFSNQPARPATVGTQVVDICCNQMISNTFELNNFAV